MPAAPIDAVIAKVQATYSGWRRTTTVERMRADWDALFWSDATGATSEPADIPDVEGAWVGGLGLARDRVFLYLHGGGYKVGSVRSHFDLIARISAASGIAGLGIDYRRAPEHRFPAPIEDLGRVLDWLLEQGIAPGHIALVGDSAGANLALAGAIDARVRSLPRFGAIVLMSPWTDLAANGESYVTRAERDPIHQRGMILRMAADYLGGADPADPLASPINADLVDLPPILIQVGDRETVLSDAVDLAAKIDRAGGNVTCEVEAGMIHVFQQFPELPEARAAIERIGAFLARHLRSDAETDLKEE